MTTPSGCFDAAVPDYVSVAASAIPCTGRAVDSRHRRNPYFGVANSLATRVRVRRSLFLGSSRRPHLKRGGVFSPVMAISSPTD